MARLDVLRPKLIVPLDGSSLAEAALPLARGLAKALGGHMVLVGVIPTPGQLIAQQGGAIGTYVGADHVRLESEARAYLEATLSWLRASGFSAEASVRQGKPAAEIGEVAREHGAAAVVMATHGRTGLARALLGSVAGDVLHLGTQPGHPGPPARAAQSRGADPRDRDERGGGPGLKASGSSYMRSDLAQPERQPGHSRLTSRPDRTGRITRKRSGDHASTSAGLEGSFSQANGSELLATIKNLIHAGNVRRITIKQEGHTIAEFPLTFGVVGAALAPALAAIGAIAALVTDCTIEIERDDDLPSGAGS